MLTYQLILKHEVTMLLRHSVANLLIIYAFIVICLMCGRNLRYSCGIKEKGIPFSVSLLYYCGRIQYLNNNMMYSR